jgi:hypothetical protein
MTSRRLSIPVRHNVFEYIAILAWWVGMLMLIASEPSTTFLLSCAVVIGCWTKAVLFGAENLKQLFEAARSNMQHHHFLILMGINMSQMILSFALDFHLLFCINPKSFLGMASDIGLAEVLFDFFYLSTLNFSFFGYSDILPQTIPAKIVNLTEIVLAFVTVIFLLSDFMNLKESLRTSSLQDASERESAESVTVDQDSKGVEQDSKGHE